MLRCCTDARFTGSSLLPKILPSFAMAGMLAGFVIKTSTGRNGRPRHPDIEVELLLLDLVLQRLAGCLQVHSRSRYPSKFQGSGPQPPLRIPWPTTCPAPHLARKSGPQVQHLATHRWLSGLPTGTSFSSSGAQKTATLFSLPRPLGNFTWVLAQETSQRLGRTAMGP